MEKTKELLLLRGPPGSGKTTTAKILVPGKQVAADDYMLDEEGNYAFDPKRLPECHGKCMVQTEDWMKQEAPLIAVHNTFTKNWEMGAYLELAEKYGYRVHVLKKEGDYGNIHSVPKDTVDRMKRDYEPFDLKKIQKSSTR